MQSVLLVVAVVGVILSILYAVGARPYPFGSWSYPGPGMYPLGVAILIFLASIGVALEAKYKTAREQIKWPHGVPLWRVLAIIGAMLIYFIALHYLGHIIASMGVTFAALQVMGGLRWPLKIFLTLAISASSYYLFAILLSVPLPMGIWSG